MYQPLTATVNAASRSYTVTLHDDEVTVCAYGAYTYTYRDANALPLNHAHRLAIARAIWPDARGSFAVRYGW